MFARMLLLPDQKLRFHQETSGATGPHHHAMYRRSSSSWAAARTPPRPAPKLVAPDQVPQPRRLSEATIFSATTTASPTKPRATRSGRTPTVHVQLML